MPTRVILPDQLSDRLQQRAATHSQSLDEFVVAALERILGEEDALSLEDVVARIQGTGPDLRGYTPPSQSLVSMLADAPQAAPLDVDEWKRAWGHVEAEMKAITRANDQAEGRG